MAVGSGDAAGVTLFFYLACNRCGLELKLRTGEKSRKALRRAVQCAVAWCEVSFVLFFELLLLPLLDLSPHCGPRRQLRFYWKRT